MTKLVRYVVIIEVLATMCLTILISAALAELTDGDWNVWVSALFGLIVGAAMSLFRATRGRL